ncbi:unnamed protein product [Sympodiomycopsis kandeliae]
MSFSNVARSTAAGVGRRSASSQRTRTAVLSSAVASTSKKSSQVSQSQSHSRSNSTAAAAALGQNELEYSDEPFGAVPPVARSDPHLYHTLLPAPTSVLASLAARLGLPTNDEVLLSQVRVALTHPSWVELRDKHLQDHKQDLGEPMVEQLEEMRESASLQSNAQLATVGNSLLGMLASEFLHLQYPNLPTRVFKAALSSHVGPGTLVDVAVELGLGAKGVAKWDTNTKVTRTRGDLRPASSKDILAQAMRACVGLIFQTKGMAATRQFVTSTFLSRLPLPPSDFGPATSSSSATSSHPLASLLKFNNPKRSLSMIMEKHGFERPQSRLIAETGRLTQSPVFGVGVYSGNQKVGEGWGSAIRMAEYRAAEDALRRLYLRKSSPLASDEIPSATLDEELRGSTSTAAPSESSPILSSSSSLGKDVWSVGKRSSSSQNSATSKSAAAAAMVPFRPRALGESEIVYDNKR